jgi:hypothetical protein
MPAWAWALIAVAIVAVVGAVVWMMLTQRRSARLRQQFGPEYDRTLERSDGRRAAERDLAERRQRREQLDIRPLSPAARDRYAREWQRVQAEFVDTPGTAVSEADILVLRVMRDRGYPTEEFDRRADDISVEHPTVVQNYRRAHALSERSAQGEASTEDLRQGLQDYRALFDELLDATADEPTGHERALTDDDRVGETMPTAERRRS